MTCLPAGLTKCPSHQPGPVIRQQLRPSICLWPDTQHSPQPTATQECSPVPASSSPARMSHPASPSQRLLTLQNPVQGSLPAGSLPRPHPLHSQVLPTSPGPTPCHQLTQPQLASASRLPRGKLLGGRTLYCKAPSQPGHMTG